MTTLPVTAWLWAIRLRPGSWNATFRPSLAGTIAVTATSLLRLAYFVYLAFASKYFSWLALERSRLSTLRDIPMPDIPDWMLYNGSWILVLLSVFGFLSLRSPYFLLALPDLLYDLVGRAESRSAIDHGELPITLGLLALGAVDALAKNDSLRTSTPLRIYLAAVLGIASGWASGFISPASRMAALLPPNSHASHRAPTFHEALRDVPPDVNCATHSSFTAWLATRCHATSFGARFPAADGVRYARMSVLLPPPDIYLIDIGRVAGQRSSKGFQGVLTLDGGCIVVNTLKEEVDSQRCRKRWERNDIIVIECSAKRYEQRDESLSRRFEQLASSCTAANGGLD